LSRIKIGRNDLCPCGSGRKLKYCCLSKLDRTPADTSRQQRSVSLLEAADVIRQCATERCSRIIVLGVFVLCADKKGNAWLFEVTGSDAVCLVKAGEVQKVLIDENVKTIEIDYQYSFLEQDGLLVLNAYENKGQVIFHKQKSSELLELFEQVRKKCTPELLASLHVDQ